MAAVTKYRVPRTIEDVDYQLVVLESDFDEAVADKDREIRDLKSALEWAEKRLDEADGTIGTIDARARAYKEALEMVVGAIPELRKIGKRGAFTW